MKSLIAICFGLFALGACSDKKRGHDYWFNPESQHHSPISFSDIDYSPLSDYIPSEIKYIQIEALDGDFLPAIDKIIIQDSTIFLLDKSIRKAIWAVDFEGKVKFRIANQGLGPGQYVDIKDFTICKGKLVLLEPTRNSLLIFDGQVGNLLENRSFLRGYPIDEIECIDSTLWAYAGDRCLGGTTQCFGLFEFDFGSGNLLNRFHSIEKKYSNSGFSNSDYLSKSGDELIYLFYFSNVFFQRKKQTSNLFKLIMKELKSSQMNGMYLKTIIKNGFNKFICRKTNQLLPDLREF